MDPKFSKFLSQFVISSYEQKYNITYFSLIEPKRSYDIPEKNIEEIWKYIQDLKIYFLEAASYCLPKLNNKSSLNQEAINWIPMGSPAFDLPAGIEIAGTPAKFTDTVKTSERYICMGSSVFSPILKAGVAETGERITSKLLKACRKSSLINDLTFCALP